MKKILGFIVVTFLASCSSINVTYDYDKDADFSEYETYEFLGWADESDKILSQIDKKRIQEAFAAEFAARGLELVESGGDMAVSLFIVVNEKTGVTAYTDYYTMGGVYGRPYVYGPGWGWGYGYSTTRYQEYDYLVGTLVLDVFDNESRNLVWQGVGSKTIDDDANTAVREKNIKRVARAIMNYFPVKPVKE